MSKDSTSHTHTHLWLGCRIHSSILLPWSYLVGVCLWFWMSDHLHTSFTFLVFIILIAGRKRKNLCKEMLMSRLCLTMVMSDPEAQLDKVYKLCKTATVCRQLDGCRSARVKIQSHPICGLFCFSGVDAASLLTVQISWFRRGSWGLWDFTSDTQMM